MAEAEIPPIEILPPTDYTIGIQPSDPITVPVGVDKVHITVTRDEWKADPTGKPVLDLHVLFGNDIETYTLAGTFLAFGTDTGIPSTHIEFPLPFINIERFVQVILAVHEQVKTSLEITIGKYIESETKEIATIEASVGYTDKSIKNAIIAEDATP